MVFNSRRAALLAVSCVALGVAGACASFSETNDPAADAGTDADTPADARTDAAPPTDAGVAAAADGAAPALALPCPPPKPASACDVVTTCERRLLYAPPASDNSTPWGIATDPDHVFWLAQSADSNGFNGDGAARLFRVDRVGGPQRAVELARDQPEAVEVVRDGDHVYWFVRQGGDNVLRRLPANAPACAEACPQPELVASVPHGARVTRLRRIAPGVLVAATRDGAVFRFRVDSTPPAMTSLGPLGGQDPFLTTTNEHVYVGAASQPSIMRFPTAGGGLAQPFFTNTVDAGSPGFSNVTTDCSALWTTRPVGGAQPVASIAIGPSPSIVDHGASVVDVFDVVADATHLYFGSANAFGLHAAAISGGPAAQLQPGMTVFRLAVDDQGVYWGDHHPDTGGALMMIVKD
jgi:hypothetical protein